jgi:hypothetical protein
MKTPKIHWIDNPGYPFEKDCKSIGKTSNNYTLIKIYKINQTDFLAYIADSSYAGNSLKELKERSIIILRNIFSEMEFDY